MRAYALRSPRSARMIARITNQKISPMSTVGASDQIAFAQNSSIGLQEYGGSSISAHRVAVGEGERMPPGTRSRGMPTRRHEVPASEWAINPTPPRKPHSAARFGVRPWPPRRRPDASALLDRDGRLARPALQRDHEEPHHQGADEDREEEHREVADREEHEDAAMRGLRGDAAAMQMAPAVAPPTIEDAMTRSGSAAAKGMAPSEMNESTEQPRRHAVLPFRLGEELRASTVEASAMPSGGTMPAAMTAAMICHGAWFSTEPAARPVTAKA